MTAAKEVGKVTTIETLEQRILELAVAVELYHQQSLQEVNGSTKRMLDRIEALETELVGGGREGSVLSRMSSLDHALKDQLRCINQMERTVEKLDNRISQLEDDYAKYKNRVIGIGLAWPIVVFLLIYIFNHLTT